MISIDKNKTKTVAVSVRNMSSEHWKALRKLAMVNDMALADYIAYLVEEKLNEDTSNKG